MDRMKEMKEMSEWLIASADVPIRHGETDYVKRVENCPKCGTKVNVIDDGEMTRAYCPKCKTYISR